MGTSSGERGVDKHGRPCVYVHIQVCPDPVTGIWCDGCSLSARVRFRLVSLSLDGVSNFGTVERCLRCDGYEED